MTAVTGAKPRYQSSPSANLVPTPHRLEGTQFAHRVYLERSVHGGTFMMFHMRDAAGKVSGPYELAFEPHQPYSTVKDDFGVEHYIDTPKLKLNGTWTEMSKSDFLTLMAAMDAYGFGRPSGFDLYASLDLASLIHFLGNDLAQQVWEHDVQTMLSAIEEDGVVTASEKETLVSGLAALAADSQIEIDDSAMALYRQAAEAYGLPMDFRD
jgi:hypothetical protein